MAKIFDRSQQTKSDSTSPKLDGQPGRRVVAVAAGLIVLFVSTSALLTTRFITFESDRTDEAVSATTATAGESEGAARRPSDWHWLQRTYPHYQADPDAMRSALAQRRELIRASKIGGSEWSFLGPENIGGRIVDIEYNPVDTTIVYFAAATGGVFRSDDAGSSWLPIFDEQAVLTIGDIGIDPSHPETLYVGTGEANGGHNNFAGGGVYKSVNGGLTWSYTGLEEVVSIGRVVVDPLNSDRVFVAAVGSYFAPSPERGLYRSLDGGSTWNNVLSISDSTGVIDLVVNPRDSDTLFVATWERVRRPNGAIFLHGAGSAVRRSTDGGDTWEELGASHGLPDPDQYLDGTGRPTFGRIGLAMSQSDPKNVYALYTTGFSFLGLYRSRDGGDTWTEVPADNTLRSVFSDFSWYFGQVRVKPTDPETIFALDVYTARTTDGGTTWDRLTSWHPDYHALAFNPQNDETVLFGTDGGLEKSTDGGAKSTAIRNLPITQFYEIAFDPTSPDIVFGGTQDNGTVRSAGTQTTNWSGLTGGDGFYVIVNPDDPSIVYTTSQNGQLYRSGGTIVNASMYKSNWSTPIAMDPDDSNTLYYGSERLLRTANGGQSWSAVSPNLTSQAVSERLGTITTISIAPSDANVIYVGTDDGNVWVTQDRAATWTSITSSLPQRWVTRIQTHPSNPAMAVVTFSGLKWRDHESHVFSTMNHGQNWLDISGNLPDAPVNALALDPADPDQIFVGTDVGAFYTSDAGLEWQVLGTGLPAVAVYDLKFIEEERRIIAGTHGRSMYSIDSPGNPTSTERDIQLSDSRSAAFPNPSVNDVTIEFDVEGSENYREGETAATAETSVGFGRQSSRAAPFSVVIYDILGRRVRSLSARNQNTNLVSVMWDGSDDTGSRAPAGVYFARLELNLVDSVPRPVVTIVRVD